ALRRLPGDDRHVVPRQELLDLCEAPSVLGRIERWLAVTGGEVDPRRFVLRHVEDRRREGFLSLEGLDIGGAAQAGARVVELRHLVLLDELLLVARAEENRSVAQPELAGQRLGARRLAPRIDELDLDFR